MPNVTTCPTNDVLHSLLHGQILGSESELLVQHLEHCERCIAAVRSAPIRDTLCDAVQANSTASDFADDAAVRSLMDRLRRVGQPSIDEYTTVGSPVVSPIRPEKEDETLDFLAPAQGSGEIGWLGSYRVLRVLGAGGMGVVLEAEDLKLKRRVALKVMKRSLAKNESAKRRFLREAESTAAVKSDHIITIHQVDEANGVPFLAMEFLEGVAMDVWLEKPKQLNVAQVLRIAREMATGLAAAHERGLIHRDIKPGNVWLEKPTGRVKILDFGLARAAKEDVQLTQTGAIVGTPAYMAPEQARGEEVDHRCDLFSLGCVLYRLTTGKLPFPGDTTMAVLTSLATDTPKSVQQLNPNLPPRLVKLIEALLAKKPAERPASARAVIAEIQAIQRELVTPAPVPASAPIAREEATLEVAQPVPATAPKKRSRGPLVAVALGLLALAAVVFGVVLLMQTSDGKVVRIECDDPAIKIAFDEGELKIVGAYKDALSLKPGKHGLKIKKGDFEFETDKLVVRKGDRIVLKIEVLQGKVQIVQDGKGVLDSKDLLPLVKGDPDRRAAEYVLSIGGRITVRVNDQHRDVNAVAELPKENFLLTSFILPTNQKVSDAGLAHFSGCKNLTQLSLNATQVSDAGLAHFSGSKNLTFLDLSHTQVSDAGLAHFKDCKNLTHLDLHNTPVTDAGLAHFSDCKNLTFLNLHGPQVSDAGLANFKACKKLTTLYLSGPQVSDAGLANFKDCKNLTTLHMNGPQVTDAGLANFSDCKNLEALTLNGPQVSDAGLAHLKECKDLTHLDLRNTKVSDAGLAHLKKCKNLTHLGLSYMKVSDAGLAHFKDCKNLTSLYLAAAKVSDAGLAHFKDCKNLTILLLHETQVSDAGLAHFSGCKNLGHLDLIGTKVGDAGLAHLKDCKNLTYLNVQKTKVTAKALADFHAAVPACKIEHDGGVIEPKKK